MNELYISTLIAEAPLVVVEESDRHEQDERDILFSGAIPLTRQVPFKHPPPYHLLSPTGLPARHLVISRPDRREQEARATHSLGAIPPTHQVQFKRPPPYHLLQPGYAGGGRIISRSDLRALHLRECLSTLRSSDVAILLDALCPIMVDCWSCLRNRGLPWYPLISEMPSVLELNTRIWHFLGHSPTRLAWANMLCMSMRKFHKVIWFIAERCDVQKGCLAYMLCLDVPPDSAQGMHLLRHFNADALPVRGGLSFDSESTHSIGDSDVSVVSSSIWSD